MADLSPASFIATCVSVDGSPALVARTKLRGARLAATLAQRPGWQARRAVEIGSRLWKGQPVAQAIELIARHVITADTRRVHWQD